MMKILGFKLLNYSVNQMNVKSNIENLFSHIESLPKHNSLVLLKKFELFYLEATDTIGKRWSAKDLHINIGNIITAEIFNIKYLYDLLE